jgi:hypothetical protein|tara:strand:+ start:307 stop:567 length:261 start_codon:yes stop_codon:yes gene_type:complete
MPQLVSMKDFLASGGNAVIKYKKTGILPSYVARPKNVGSPKNAPTPSYSRLTKGSKGSRQKKKKLIPVKKTGKVNNFYKSGGKVKK